MIRCIEHFRDKRANADRNPGDVWYGTIDRADEINRAGLGVVCEYFEPDYPTANEIAAAVVEAITPLINGEQKD